jgi:hypothetical protein
VPSFQDGGTKIAKLKKALEGIKSISDYSASSAIEQFLVDTGSSMTPYISQKTARIQRK